MLPIVNCRTTRWEEVTRIPGIFENLFWDLFGGWHSLNRVPCLKIFLGRKPEVRVEQRQGRRNTLFGRMGPIENLCQIALHPQLRRS